MKTKGGSPNISPCWWSRPPPPKKKEKEKKAEHDFHLEVSGKKRARSGSAFGRPGVLQTRGAVGVEELGAHTGAVLPARNFQRGIRAIRLSYDKGRL